MDDETARFAAQAFDSNFGMDGSGETLLRDLDMSVRTYRAKQVVHHEGDRVDNLYIVLDGWLTTVMNRQDGKRLLLDFHVPVDLTGLEFMANRRAESSLVAFETTRLVSLPVAAFETALLRDPVTSVSVLQTLASGYIALQAQMATFAFADAPAKVASLLLGLLRKQQRNRFDAPNVLRLPLTQMDIADALGMSNVTVSRIFTRFGEKGLVGFERGKITIHDTDGLRRETGLQSDTFHPATIT